METLMNKGTSTTNSSRERTMMSDKVVTENGKIIVGQQDDNPTITHDKSPGDDNTTTTISRMEINSKSQQQQRRRCLTCFFKTENSDGKLIPDLSNAIEKMSLLPEHGKMSSFVLESPPGDNKVFSVEQPPNLVIECEEYPPSLPSSTAALSGSASCSNYESNDKQKNNDATFFLGGFQVISTAKMVEIYLTDLEGKEAYLTTSKGIPIHKDSNKEDNDTSAPTVPWHKIIVVIPGGPRPILSLRIKLLSLLPTGTYAAKLQYMKLTARIVDPTTPRTETTSKDKQSLEIYGSASSDSLRSASSFHAAFQSKEGLLTATPEAGRGTKLLPVQPDHHHHHHLSARETSSTLSPTLVTHSDLGAAMAGVSFMARSTEKEIEVALNEQTKKMEQLVGSCFLRMEQQMKYLQRHLVVQQQLIQENYVLMKMQQETIDDQCSYLKTLMKQQDDLKVRVQSLQADMSILRYQRLDCSSSNNSFNATTSFKKKDSEEPLLELLEIEHSVIDEEPQPSPKENGTLDRDLEKDLTLSMVNPSIQDSSMIINSKEARYESDLEAENMHLKNRIRQTAQEMEDLTIACGASPLSMMAMEPSMPIGCGSLPSIPDTTNTLFLRMMRTKNEELLQLPTTNRLASRNESEADNEIGRTLPTFQQPYPQEPEPLIIENDDDDEPEVEGCFNIEVTLMEDDDDAGGQRQGERVDKDSNSFDDQECTDDDVHDDDDDDDDDDQSVINESKSQPTTVDKMPAETEGVNDDHHLIQDDETTVTASNGKASASLEEMVVDEKKESDDVDIPNSISELILDDEYNGLMPNTN